MWIFFLTHGIVVLAAVALLIRHRSALSRDRPVPSTWYSQVASVGRELNDVVESHSDTATSGRLGHSVLSIAARLDRLTRDAPASVEPEYVGRVHRLGADCQRVGYEYDARAAPSIGAGGDPLEDLRRRAEHLVEDAQHRLETFPEASAYRSGQ
ncbi:MAG: hypothetical protein ABEJ28_11900 [Salinigranum sp.]